MPHTIYSVVVDSVRGCELAQVVTGDRPVTVIGGKNAAGKSSFLDAIAITLGGKKLFPKNPIYDEKNEATVSVRLGGESTMLPWPCTVTRTLLRDDDGQITTRVRIEAEDGSEAPSPQTILNDILGPGLTFDPLAFVREKPAKQVDIVKGMVGLDFSELDAEYDRLYTERTHVNRVAKQLDGKVKQTEIHADVPTEKIDVAELVEHLREVDAHNAECDRMDRRINELEHVLQSSASMAKVALEKRDEKLSRLRTAYENAVAECNQSYADTIRTMEQEDKQRTAELEGIKETQEATIDPAPIQQKIANAADINKKWDENAARLEILTEKAGQTEKARQITKRLKEISAEKTAMADAAEWPIKGMGFGEDGLIMNGTPFQDLSSKEQMNCSVAIAMKLNPVFPFCMIRDGSLLDKDAMVELEAIVANHEGQVFIERVSDTEQEDERCHVVFEEGRLKK